MLEIVMITDTEFKIVLLSENILESTRTERRSEFSSFKKLCISMGALSLKIKHNVHFNQVDDFQAWRNLCIWESNMMFYWKDMFIRCSAKFARQFCR